MAFNPPAPLDLGELDPDDLDWARLSSAGWMTMRRVVLPIALGYSHSEVAASLGISRSRVGTELKVLREELHVLVAEAGE